MRNFPLVSRQTSGACVKNRMVYCRSMGGIKSGKR